jgi:hypothetical protein
VLAVCAADEVRAVVYAFGQVTVSTCAVAACGAV